MEISWTVAMICCIDIDSENRVQKLWIIWYNSISMNIQTFVICFKWLFILLVTNVLLFLYTSLKSILTQNRIYIKYIVGSITLCIFHTFLYIMLCKWIKLHSLVLVMKHECYDYIGKIWHQPENICKSCKIFSRIISRNLNNIQYRYF